MVISKRSNVKSMRGMLTTELVVAMGMLVLAVIPLGFSFLSEQRLCRAYYYQAVAMEIVDGEMEVLAAGEWRAFKEGSQPYIMRATAAQNLPPGRFVLTRKGNQLRLEWVPEKRGKAPGVVREVSAK